MIYITNIMEETIEKRRSERPADGYRPLTREEIGLLERQGNSAESWDGVRAAAAGFDAGRVRGCRFDGAVNIGAFTKDRLQYGGISLKTGLYGSRFGNMTTIGDDAAIHELLFCANQSIGDSVLIFGVNEISARRGRSGTSRDSGRGRLIKVINENGGRAVLPFPGMTCTDAYLWAKFRGDKELLDKFAEMACGAYGACGNMYESGSIGSNSVIINARALRGATIGPSAVVDGAELIHNSTILSDADEPTFIGPAQIRDSIVGYGNSIDSAAQLSSVVTGASVSISKAARVEHSVVGDCAQIACCEISNSLIMPMHSQHHNNSFLIAAAIGGQSNVAAGATVGSNHNSRAADGEIWAKRGFWPGLCVSLRHNSRFASFTMIAKGAYQTEFDLKLPFSLIAMDEESGAPAVFPAFWFTRNMYAVMRSAQKSAARDKRARRGQFIEHDPLAPDTVDEIFDALNLLEQYKAGGAADSLRATPLKHVDEACAAYRMMVRHYCAKNILPYMRDNGLKSLDELIDSLNPLDDGGGGGGRWLDCGGAIISERSLERVIDAIKGGGVKTWDDVHALFAAHAAAYKTETVKHAVRSLAKLEGINADGLTAPHFAAFLESVPKDCADIAARTAQSRAKDYDNPFRRATYESTEEMVSVLGPAEDAVVIKTAAEMAELSALAAELRQRR